MERKYTGTWIPKRIWESQDLSPVQKMLLAEIEVLSEDKGHCYAKNSHFCNWLGCSVQNISNHLRRLQELGAIKVVFDNDFTKEGRKIFVDRDFYYGSNPLTTSLGGLTTGLPPLTTGVTERTIKEHKSINKGETKKDVSQTLEDSPSTKKENVPPPPAAKFPAAWVALIDKAAKRPPAKMQHSSERVWKIEMPDEIAAELLECSKDALFMEQFKRTAGRKPADTVMDLFTAFLDRRLIEGEGGYQNKKEFRRHLLNFPAKYILATQNRPEPPKQQPKQNAPQIPILR